MNLLLYCFFCSLQKGSLGRVCPEEGAKSKKGLWYAIPGQVPGVGKLGCIVLFSDKIKVLPL